MTKRTALVALVALALTGCGKAPATMAVHPAKAAAKAAAPSVTLIRGDELAAGLNNHQYDEHLAAARQAVSEELSKEGLASPLADRHLTAFGGVKVTSVKVTKGDAALGAVKLTGPNGGSIGAIGAKGPNGSVGAIDIKGPNGGEVAAIGAKGPNGGAVGVVAAKGPDGAAAVVVGAKAPNGTTSATVVAKNGEGGAIAAQGVKTANGTEAGRWIATDGNGTTAWGAGATDAKGNAVGATVVTKDGKIVAQRWIKGANGDALLETVAYDPLTHVLAYSLTALVNGKPVTATATVLLAA